MFGRGPQARDVKVDLFQRFGGSVQRGQGWLRATDRPSEPLRDQVAIGEPTIRAALPARRINGMNTGNPEEFMVSLGFYDPESSPSSPTIALWLSTNGSKVNGYKFIYGGIN